MSSKSSDTIKTEEPTSRDFFRNHTRHLQVLLLLFLLSKQMLADRAFDFVLLVSKQGRYSIEFPPDDALARELRSPNPVKVFVYLPVLTGAAKLFGGYMALKRNNKYMLLSISVLNTILLGSVPVMTVHWGLVAKMLIESVTIVLRGFSEAVIHNIVAHWLPQSEMAVCVGLLFTAEPIAYLATYSPSHWIGPKYGASVIFYYVTFFHVAWDFVYFIFGAQDPPTCYFLSKEEKEYIFRQTGEKRRIGSKDPIPWKDIVRTPIYYGIFASEIAYTWSYSITHSAVGGLHGGKSATTKNLFAMALVLMPLFVLIIFKILDLGRKLDLINNNDARKIANTIGLWGTGLFALMIGYCRSERVVYTVYIAYRLTAAFIFVGYKVTIYNISPNYAALVAAFVTGVSIMTMGLKSNLVEWMVEDKMSHRSFKILLYIVALMSYVANIIFIISGHIDTKKFDAIGATDWRKESILSYP